MRNLLLTNSLNSEQDTYDCLYISQKELAQLRVSKVSAAPQVKLARIRIVRKAIAKVLTVINEKRRDQARVDHKKKRIPADLRHKKTRAFRKRLTKHETTRKTVRQQKRDNNFKLRKFALAA
uniref:L35 ribosomal protein n=1 Tax=Sterkiella nova TaxID=200597 RepID=J9VAV3_STENO|nr:L35 ribosomal protein [Sterkiella nova]